MTFVPRLVRNDDGAPVVVHASPGLLMQFSQCCFRLVALGLCITSNVLGFFADALYQAGMMAAHLGGLEGAIDG